MTQIVLNIDDASLVSSLKQILGAIKGVTIANPLKKKKDDPTTFSEEEFFARIDEAKKGPSYELKEGETLEDLLKRVG
jgi:hypothetical protein